MGGVALGVTPETAAQTYEQLRACLDPPLGTYPGETVVVAPQIDSGIEVFIGAKQDESFGFVLVFGLGGRLLEILDRSAMLVPPFDHIDALELIERSGVHPLLDGFRGGPKADFDQLANLILRVGQLAAAIGNRLEVLELNPVIVNARHPGGIIADARLLLYPGVKSVEQVDYTSDQRLWVPHSSLLGLEWATSLPQTPGHLGGSEP